VTVRRIFAPLLFTVGCSDYQVVKKTFSESFRQAAREEGIDILWVVDDSATMYEEHELLMNSADAFIGFVSNTVVDFNLGIVSTDLEEGGSGLLGPVLTAESTQMVDTFVAQIDMDRAGSRNERGFDAAIIGADPVANAEFARAKADLEMVIFSDEDDHSTIETNTFLSTLQAQRPDAQIKIHAVVGDPPAGCVSALAAADVGARYLEVQAITEGRRESICTLDYGEMLARVALDVVGLETSFVLEKVPEVPTIELLVDGIEIHHREKDGWSYNPGDNSIYFDGFAVPSPGSVVVVTYSEWYGPMYDREEDTGL
jgi:hypothetical protein